MNKYQKQVSYKVYSLVNILSTHNLNDYILVDGFDRRPVPVFESNSKDDTVQFLERYKMLPLFVEVHSMIIESNIFGTKRTEESYRMKTEAFLRGVEAFPPVVMEE